MNMRIAFLGILILLAILAVVVAVVVGLVLAARKSKAGRWLAGIVAGVLLAVLAATFLFGYRVEPRQFVPVAERATVPVRTESDIKQLALAQPWTSQAGQEFLADTYPSEAAAAEGMAKHLISSQIETSSNEKSPWVVRLSGTASAEAMQRAAEIISKSSAVGQVIPAADGEELPAGDKRPIASIQLDAAHQGPAGAGRAIATLKANKVGMMSIQARFVKKLWVDDLAGFLSRDPQKSWLVVASDRPCTDHHEARQRALDIAAAKLVEPVRSVLARGGSGAGSSQRRDSHWLQRKIRAELDSSPLHIKDQFTQRYRRPYGDVWQHWLLVDASQNKVLALRAGALRQVAAERASWLWRGLSLAGVVGLILLVYLFLNLATRGYYVWSLRIAAAVLGAAAVLILLNWA